SYPEFSVPTAGLPREHLRGPDAANDAGEYFVYRLREPQGAVPAGKYLLDDAGHIKCLEDPGINGAIGKRDNGESVFKYKAPKAMLMSFIIDGILSRK